MPSIISFFTTSADVLPMRDASSPTGIVSPTSISVITFTGMTFLSALFIHASVALYHVFDTLARLDGFKVYVRLTRVNVTALFLGLYDKFLVRAAAVDV